MYQRQVRNRVKPTGLMFAWLLLATACGGSDSDADGVADEPGSENSTTTEASAASTSDSDVEGNSTQGEEDDTAMHPAPDLSGLQVVTYPAMGGLRLGLPLAVEAYSEGDYVEIRHPDGIGNVVVARISHASSGSTIANIEDFTKEMEDIAGAAITQTQETRQVLGQEASGYELRTDESNVNTRLFPGRPLGTGGNTSWAPLPNADLFLANVEGGVLVVGVVGENLASFPALAQLMDEVIVTLSLTSANAAVAPLDPDSELFALIGEPVEVAPVAPDSDGPPALQDIFTPVAGGDYQLVNLGSSATITIPDGWFVAPNFPGFIVLAEGAPVGPGDRDVIFLYGVTGISGVGLGLAYDSPPLPITDINALLESPPSNLSISDIDTDAVIGGLPAVQFDVRVSPEATCQIADPCGFVFSLATPGVIKDIKPGTVTRIWWIEGGEFGPLMISASVSEGSKDWLDGGAQDLLGSLTLS